MKVGGDGDDRGLDGWMASQLNGHEFEQAPGDGEGQGAWRAPVHAVTIVRHD